MTLHTWEIIILITGINVTTIILGVISIATRLTRIETDLKWIKRGCPKCQPTSDSPSI